MLRLLLFFITVCLSAGGLKILYLKKQNTNKLTSVYLRIKFQKDTDVLPDILTTIVILSAHLHHSLGLMQP